MTPVSIRVGDNEFDAIIGCGLLDDAGSAIGNVLSPRRCAIITDTSIGGLFGKRLEDSLRSAGFDPLTISIPPGEQAKTLQQAGSICERMIVAGLDRQSFVVGLGGGVIGDISGFVAAIYHRGTPHVQIPTTLLAMVDSSIGGKNGVNTSQGKNLLGAVHHPSLVLDDMDLLKTLPTREFNQGFGEIIKHAIIADAGMFETLKTISPASLRAADTLTSLVRRNVEIKARIVANDEHDRSGHRAVLNFGHTIGHAIERAGQFREFLHGEAISLGMVAASNISQKRAGLPVAERDAIVEMLGQFGLPTRLPEKFPRQEILEALPLDKKFEGGRVRFVVTPAIGSAYLSSDVTMEDIREAVEQL